MVQFYECYKNRKHFTYVLSAIMFLYVFMTESLEALENVRPRWPNFLDIDDDEPESTGVEEEKENEPINHFIEQNIDQVVSKNFFYLFGKMLITYLVIYIFYFTEN